MRRIIAVGAINLASVATFATAAHADVILHGPFGGLIVVPSSSDVRVGPGGVAVVPAPVPPPPHPPAPIPVVPLPAAPLPAPTQVVPVPRPAIAAPVLPQEFAKSFQPVPGAYDIAFVHPRSHQPVTVSFVLPPGNPRVYYVPTSLVFDYGRHEIEIRFQIGGRVKVIQR
jgi:hypothetical protein